VPSVAERDPSPGSALYFEEFVRKLAPRLIGASGAYAVDADKRDVGVDIVVESPESGTYLIEVRADTPSTSARLGQIAQRLRQYALSVPSATNLVLAIPGVLGDERRAELERAGVMLWDGRLLASTARGEGIELPEGIDFPSSLLLTKPPEMQLRRRLARTPVGTKYWSQYQGLCSDLVEFLFCPPLNNPLYENPTGNRVNRRDIILANYAPDGFWEFLRGHYNADFVVVDAKNSGNLVRKADVLQIANYLTLRGTGLFGIIMCRRGADSGAVWTIREHWVLHGKLIVTLNDDDVRQMITAKASGDEPASTIRQKIEDFRLGL
jgi:hypothetical protein